MQIHWFREKDVGETKTRPKTVLGRGKAWNDSGQDVWYSKSREEDKRDDSGWFRTRRVDM